MIVGVAFNLEVAAGSVGGSNELSNSEGGGSSASDEGNKLSTKGGSSAGDSSPGLATGSLSPRSPLVVEGGGKEGSIGRGRLGGGVTLSSISNRVRCSWSNTFSNRSYCCCRCGTGFGSSARTFLRRSLACLMLCSFPCTFIHASRSEAPGQVSSSTDFWSLRTIRGRLIRSWTACSSVRELIVGRSKERPGASIIKAKSTPNLVHVTRGKQFARLYYLDARRALTNLVLFILRRVLR